MSYAAGLSWQLAFYAVTSNFLHNLLIDDDAGALLLVCRRFVAGFWRHVRSRPFLHNPHHLTPNLLNLGQESVVCSHALRGGDWVWLA